MVQRRDGERSGEPGHHEGADRRGKPRLLPLPPGLAWANERYVGGDRARLARDHPRRLDRGDAVAELADPLLDGRTRGRRLVQPEGQDLAVVVDPDVLGPAEAANGSFDLRGAGRAVHALHVVSQGRPGLGG